MLTMLNDIDEVRAAYSLGYMQGEQVETASIIADLYRLHLITLQNAARYLDISTDDAEELIAIYTPPETAEIDL